MAGAMFQKPVKSIESKRNQGSVRGPEPRSCGGTRQSHVPCRTDWKAETQWDPVPNLPSRPAIAWGLRVLIDGLEGMR